MDNSEARIQNGDEGQEFVDDEFAEFDMDEEEFRVKERERKSL